jgi:hypothetical protein
LEDEQAWVGREVCFIALLAWTAGETIKSKELKPWYHFYTISSHIKFLILMLENYVSKLWYKTLPFKYCDVMTSASYDTVQ